MRDSAGSTDDPPAQKSVSNHTYRSGELTLAAHLERPSGIGSDLPGVVICHGFPAGEGGGANSPATFPELAARITREMGWVVIVPAPRGMPGSEGSFSLDGWLEDVIAAADGSNVLVDPTTLPPLPTLREYEGYARPDSVQRRNDSSPSGAYTARW